MPLCGVGGVTRTGRYTAVGGASKGRRVGPYPVMLAATLLKFETYSNRAVYRINGGAVIHVDKPFFAPSGMVDILASNKSPIERVLGADAAHARLPGTPATRPKRLRNAKLRLRTQLQNRVIPGRPTRAITAQERQRRQHSRAHARQGCPSPGRA